MNVRMRLLILPYQFQSIARQRSRAYLTCTLPCLQQQHAGSSEPNHALIPNLRKGRSYKSSDTFWSITKTFNYINYSSRRTVHSYRSWSKLPCDIPNPVECGSIGESKAQRFQISDVDGYLSNAAKEEIQGYMNSSKTEIAVVLIRKMKDSFIKDSNSNLNLAAERFARSLHDSWGVGHATKNDGVLIFFSIDDRVLFFSTGKGVDDLFDEMTIDSILGEMRQYLKQENYDSAVKYALLQVIDVIKYKHTFWHSRRNNEIEKLIFFLLAALITFVLISASQGNDKKKEDKSRRETQLIAAENEVDRIFDTKEESCPYCLEEYTHEADNKSKVRLECGHVFCLQCFDYMQGNGIPGTLGSCAICGKPLIEKMVVDEEVHSLEDTTPVPFEDDSEEITYRLNRFQHKHNVTFEPNKVDSILEQFRNSAHKAKETIKLEIKEEIAKERHEYIVQRMQDSEQQETARKSGQSGSSRDGFSGGKSSGGHGGSW